MNKQRENFFATKSELDLFSTRLISHSVEDARWAEIRAVNSLNSNGPLEFRIVASSDYLDLSHTQLFLTAKIVDSTGKDIDIAKDTVSPCNNFLNSMFEHLSVELNHKSITVPSNSYNYRSYFEKLLNYGSDAKATHLTSGLFIEDEAGKFDDINSKGFKARKALMNKKGEIEMSSYIHNELSNQNKYLINYINVTYKFNRAADSFSLIKSAEDKKDYKVFFSSFIVRFNLIVLLF